MDDNRLKELGGGGYFKELRAMSQLVSGYLDFAERQAEREIPMTMEDWAKHLDGILTLSSVEKDYLESIKLLEQKGKQQK